MKYYQLQQKQLARRNLLKLEANSNKSAFQLKEFIYGLTLIGLILASAVIIPTIEKLLNS